MSYYNGERIEDEFPEKQPIPSLNAGSLEEAAKEYGEKHTDFDAFDHKDHQLAGRLKAAFLAGAAYVKGGEEKGFDPEKFISELSADNPYKAYTNGEKTGNEGNWLKYNCSSVWNQCVARAIELLNQSK